MLSPKYSGGCPACSAIADGFNGFTVHLENHDLSMVAVLRAPVSALQAYEQKMGGHSDEFHPLKVNLTMTLISHLPINNSFLEMLIITFVCQHEARR